MSSSTAANGLGTCLFGAYHWVEINGVDRSRDLPSDWQLDDLDALEQAGFLKKLSTWQNPLEHSHRTIAFGFTH